MITSVLSSIVTILVIGGVGYLIFRSKSNDEDQHKELKDAYFFFVSFIALGIVFWAIADLARVIIYKVFFTTSQATRYYQYSSANNDAYLRRISLRVSSFLVAFPVYMFHWFKANFKSQEEIDTRHKRIYLFAVMIFSALLTLGMGMGLVYGLVNEVLGVSSSSKSELAYTLPYSLLGFGVWLLHYMSYNKLSRGKKSKLKADKRAPMDSPSHAMTNKAERK